MGADASSEASDFFLDSPAGTIPGIDLVQPLLFQVWDEGESAYLTKNTAKYNPFVDTGHSDFKEGNLKHAINGYVYCNMPDVSVQRVQPACDCMQAIHIVCAGVFSHQSRIRLSCCLSYIWQLMGLAASSSRYT